MKDKVFIDDYGKEYPSRKAYVIEQRNKLKDKPEIFVKENILTPFTNYWKENTFHAIYTFIKWVMIMYLSVGLIQAVTLDSNYCDSTINEYDGKIMYVLNDYVEMYNNKASEMQNNNSILDKSEQEFMVNQFNKEYNIVCEHDWKRWNNEGIYDRFKTVMYNYKKVLFKIR